MRIQTHRLTAMIIAFLPWLSPIVVFSAQAFHTTGFSAAMSGGILYLTLRMMDTKRLPWVATFLVGLAGGIKANGLFAGTIVFLRSGLEIFRVPFRGWLHTHLLMINGLVVGFILGFAPTLFLGRFLFQENVDVVGTFSRFIHWSRENPLGGAEHRDPVFLFTQGFAKHLYPGWFFFILLGTGILWAWVDRLRRPWVLAVLGGVIIISSYLLLMTGQGPFNISRYFIAGGLSALILLSFWSRIPQGPWALALLAFVLCFTRKEELQWNYLHFPNKFQDPNFHKQLSTMEQLRPLLQEAQSPVQILTDHRVPLPVSNFHEGFTISESFDDLHSFSWHSNFDYIFLSRASPAFQDLEQTSHHEIHEKLMKNQQQTMALVSSGTFFGHRYTKIFDDPQVLGFKRIKN